MKLRLLVVGKAGKDFRDYEASLKKRLQSAHQFEIVELPESKAKQLNQIKADEAKHILKAAQQGFILFDEKGKSFTSMQWADFFKTQVGNASIDFVIGGAAGVSDEVRQQAKHTWCLSKLTLPHQLARVLVIEQLYRAFSIIQGHPYHKV
ncbi:23S rRNA (pseudouridine(1915)-N(3))-methyltransferase RlmH [Ghiorsea bivora]|uniref:23S rRNA (pseudouridine(1915)-N(3))-methyltransferase RlmH n=1 Tax=Ghiorsea bivora TaxID=1485545 RepID=UPI00056E7020|nr:23S rRNA (pseudouridine(1915)-N(3))-methyltransferase RlmH [Ghiorsea bivora]